MDGVIWLLNSPDESLPFILADSGFDVWLVSGRGSKYSSHISLTPNDLVVLYSMINLSSLPLEIPHI
ncbi:putative triacylglycerol lipase [Medicago truncatula]|uniref:Putative triacylglycerol lipase n=1 Tax=Medicago truncatula TaxID=3880 RepID=A0A396HEB2_MEDTR|nr:putative triacylglycerol lipase [Medicago truncatula]